MTRIREDKSVFRKARTRTDTYNWKTGTRVNTSISKSTNPVLGVAKQTLDEPDMPGYRRSRKGAVRSLVIKPGQHLPIYAAPYVANHVPYPHPFRVRNVVGPDNSYCEFSVIYKGTNVNSQTSVYTGDLVANIFASDLHNWLLPTVFPTLESRYTDVTHLKALAKVREAQVDIGVSLGELKETVQFLASPLNSIVKLGTKHGLSGGLFTRVLDGGVVHTVFDVCKNAPLRMKRIIKAARKRLESGLWVVDTSSDFWLGYRYGVAPLLRDIENYTNLHKDGLEYVPPGVMHARSKFVKPEVTTQVNYVGGWTISLEALLRTSSVDTYRTDVQFIQKPETSLSSLDVLGLSPFQIASVAWELVPLSFVLDRFVSIGTWLSAKRPKPGTTVLGATHSLKTTREFMIAPRKFYSLSRVEPTYRYKWYAEIQTWKSTTYQRQIAFTVPLLPQFNPKLLDISQWTDHLLLAWQRMPKIKRR